MGPIPDAHLSRLHITDVVHGSFGFQFQELPEQESLDFPPLFKATGETPLFEAAEEAARLIDAAGKDDEAFVDVVEGLNPRVHDAVRNFFTTRPVKDFGIGLLLDCFDRKAECPVCSEGCSFSVSIPIRLEASEKRFDFQREIHLLHH